MAVDALIETLTSENDSARLAASKALLDRIGIEAPSASAPAVVVESGGDAQLSDTELHGRVRRMILSELAGLGPHELAERVRAVLDGEG